MKKLSSFRFLAFSRYQDFRRMANPRQIPGFSRRFQGGDITVAELKRIIDSAVVKMKRVLVISSHGLL
jgi:hypothetical protein